MDGMETLSLGHTSSHYSAHAYGYLSKRAPARETAADSIYMATGETQHIETP